MSPVTTFAVLLAALAAVGYSVGVRLQHQGVRTVTGHEGFGLRSLPRLVRAPSWLWGMLSLTAATILHAVALGFAPLSVIQPIGVLALPLTTILNARSQGATLNARALLAVLAAVGGLAGFVVLAGSASSVTNVSPSSELIATQVSIVAAVILSVVAVFLRGRKRGLAFAAAAGVLYGFVSLLVHSVATSVTLYGLEGVPILPAIGIILAMLIGGWLLQVSYASGPPDLSVACLTVIDPLVAVGFGVVLLGEAAGASTWTSIAEAMCAVIACVGVLGLATFHPERSQGRISGKASGSHPDAAAATNQHNSAR